MMLKLGQKIDLNYLESFEMCWRRMQKIVGLIV